MRNAGIFYILRGLTVGFHKIHTKVQNRVYPIGGGLWGGEIWRLHVT